MFIRFHWICLLLLMFYGREGLFAQMTVATDAVRIEYPNRIMLPFRVECTDSMQFLDWDRVRLWENGREIIDFEVDYGWHCPVTAVCTAILLDRGDAMETGLPSGRSEGVDVVRKYLSTSERDHATADRTALAGFNEKMFLVSRWTTDYAPLRECLDTLRAGGRSAIWDAAIALSQQLPNQSLPYGILLVTTGLDTTSTSTVDEVIAVARRKAIRIYPVGVGPNPVDSTLSRLALATGGRYFSHPDSAAIAGIYRRLFLYEDEYGWFGAIAYNCPCDTDSVRSVRACFYGKQPCDDTLCVNYSYIGQTASPRVAELSIPASSGFGGSSLEVPVIWQTSINEAVDQASIDLHMDSTHAQLVDVYSRWHGEYISRGRFFPLPSGYRVIIQPARELNKGDTAAIFRFHLAPVAQDTVISFIIENWQFWSGCLAPKPVSGLIDIRASATHVSREQSTLLLSMDIYPNPFANRTMVQLGMRNEELGIGKSAIRNPQSAISLKVYDLLGREVLDLTSRMRDAGEAILEGSELPGPGVYFCRLLTPRYNLVRAVHLIR